MAVLGGGVYYTFGLQDLVTPALSGMMIKKEEAMRNMGLLQNTIKQTESTFRNFARGAYTLGGAFIQISIMSFVLNLTQRRLAHAHETVAVATENLAEKERRYGIASQEAEKASRRLQLAQQDLSRAAFESNLQLGLSAVQGAILVVKFVDAAKRLTEFKAATILLSAATKVYNFLLMHKITLLSIVKYGIMGAAIAAGLLASSLVIAASAAGQAEERTRKLKETVGEAPSTGLVKSFEDVTASLGEFKLSIRGITVSPILERRFEAEWRDLGSRVKSEMRRIA